MVGIWVALEDVDEECGPLVYYPGSHKLPIYLNEHVGHFSVDPKLRQQNTFEPSWNELVRVYGLESQGHLEKCFPTLNRVESWRCDNGIRGPSHGPDGFF